MNKQLHQGELFTGDDGLTRKELETFLSEGSPVRVDLAVNRNRVSMITLEFRPRGDVKLRLQEGFLHAPPEVVRALRAYIRSRRRAAWHIVSDYAQTIQVEPRTRPPRVRTKGKVHDLAKILREVNKRYFSGRVRCHITWGRVGYRRKRWSRTRSISFGSYNAESRTIRINPALDDPAVPREFVEYIVFHEILHEVVAPERRNGRTVHHTKTFRRLERSFPRVREMEATSKKLLRKLR